MGATFTVIGFGAVCSVVVPLIFKAWIAYQTAGISLAVERANAKKKEPELINDQPPLIQVIKEAPPLINEKAEPSKKQEPKIEPVEPKAKIEVDKEKGGETEAETS